MGCERAIATMPYQIAQTTTTTPSINKKVPAETWAGAAEVCAYCAKPVLPMRLSISLYILLRRWAVL